MNKIWFDLDNSPHVPLFRPVFTELEKRGIEYKITARDFAQTKELLEFWNVKHTLVGKHAGKNKIKKILNLFGRAQTLKKHFNKKDKFLAVSHGSRTQLLAAKYLKFPSVLMLDYEYTEAQIFNTLSTKLLMPVYLPEKRLKDAGFSLDKIIRYNGFKEELYLRDFVPDENFRKEIGIDESSILVVVRPPSMVGNYHDDRSEELLIESLKYFSSFKDAVCLIVNRTETEKEFINSRVGIKENIKYLEKPVNGLQLLYSADISVSGGGTMNREAALLGTNAYSIFTGRRPYLDEFLQEQGKLKFLEKAEEIKNLTVEKREIKLPSFENNVAAEVTDILLNQ